MSPFAVVVCAADVARTKPDPEGYLLAAAKLGAEPRHSIALEDSPNGYGRSGGGGLPRGGGAKRRAGARAPGRVVLASLAGVTLAD